MKIFLSFLQSEHTYPIPAYSFWQHYIKNGIQEAGHEWVECTDVDWALGIMPQTKAAHLQWKQDAWEKTIRYLKKAPADLFLSYLYPEQIDTSAITEIQKLGIPCVNFFCDNVRHFKKLPVQFADFDLSWVPEYKAIELYQKAKYSFINLPMPMWTDPRYRGFHPEENTQVTFIGSKDIQRHIFFEKVIEQQPDIPLAVYGNGWEEDAAQQKPSVTKYTLDKKILFQCEFINNQGIKAYWQKLSQSNYKRPVTQVLRSKIKGVPATEQYNELTAGSMITIGVNRYPSYHFPLLKPDSYSRLRDIEAPMLGACYLTEWTEGLDLLYDIGKEIETYKTPEEFLYKVKDLQNDTYKRKMLKVNGQKRALTDHSIPASLNKITYILGL